MDGFSRTKVGTVTQLLPRRLRRQTPRLDRHGRHGSGDESFPFGAARLRQRRSQETSPGPLPGVRGASGERSMFLPGEDAAAHQAEVRGCVPPSPGAAGAGGRGGHGRPAGAAVPQRLSNHAGIRARSSLLLRPPVRTVRRAAGRRSGLLPGRGEGATGTRSRTSPGEPEWPLGDSGERSGTHSLFQVQHVVSSML